MGTYLVLAAVIALASLCIRNLAAEHRRGERCECSGNCDTCKIQCQKNEKYYGVLRNAQGKQTNEAAK